MTSILITGATGFVGAALFRDACTRDLDITIVIRKGTKERLPEGVETAKVIEVDDLFGQPYEWWLAQFEAIDVCVHAAWYAEPGEYLQSEKNIDCMIGSVVMARAASHANVSRFIGVGTCFEYDLSFGDLTITTPLQPSTIYAACKASTFFSIDAFAATSDMDFAWCRLFYLYGRGEDDRRLVPYLRKQLSAGERVALTSGSQIRDFMDVDRAASDINAVALGVEIGPVNICSGEAITVRQLAEQIADEYGRRDLLNFGARPDNLIDPPRVVGVKN